jgi:hypothetical protein
MVGIYPSMTLEEELIKDAGNRMAAEIDFGVLSDMLCSIGWTKVILSPMAWEDGCAVDEWTATNTKGNFETVGLVWIFERPEDANWFAMRWL